MLFSEFVSNTHNLNLDAFLKLHVSPVLIIDSEATESGGRAPLRAEVLLKRSYKNPFVNMTTVGRALNNDIVLQHPGVSKIHAAFIYNLGRDMWQLIDHNSTNKTLVNGSELKPGIYYDLQDTVKIVFGVKVRAGFYSPKALWLLLQSQKIAAVASG